MSKTGRKKMLKNKKAKRIKKHKNKSKDKVTASLSKREVSSNWINFLTSSGMKEKLFSNKPKACTEEKPIQNKPKPPAITKVLSLDCEMVADLSDQDMLARVSIVNFKLECVYDKYVKPTAKVGDYRTRFSGIREEDLSKGVDFETVREEVRNILYNKILVGHALFNDFKVLKFGHHRRLIRDTANYLPFKEGCATASPSLKKLAKVFLDENIQEGEHDSVEDAKTAMKLYKKFRKEWEMSFIKSKPSKESEKQHTYDFEIVNLN